ncbi:MAG: hypothetical protein ACKO3H_11755 [Verrucomicrobiota bacterium]
MAEACGRIVVRLWHLVGVAARGLQGWVLQCPAALGAGAPTGV